MINYNVPENILRQNLVPNAGCVINGQYYDVQNLLHQLSETENELAAQRCQNRDLSDVLARQGVHNDVVAFVEQNIGDIPVQHQSFLLRLSERAEHNILLAKQARGKL